MKKKNHLLFATGVAILLSSVLTPAVHAGKKHHGKHHGKRHETKELIADTQSLACVLAKEIQDNVNQTEKALEFLQQAKEQIKQLMELTQKGPIIINDSRYMDMAQKLQYAGYGINDTKDDWDFFLTDADDLVGKTAKLAKTPQLVKGMVIKPVDLFKEAAPESGDTANTSQDSQQDAGQDDQGE